MAYKHLPTQLLQLLIIGCALLHDSAYAKPSYSFLDGYASSVERISDSFDAYDSYIPYAAPLTESQLHRLRRGYYYVDGGYITAIPVSAVPARRRQDTDADSDTGYDALVKYKPTHAKRKKLFVPNLFG